MIEVPKNVTGIRLVRKVVEELRVYEAVYFTRGCVGVCTTLRQCMVWDKDPETEYGLADLIDEQGDIVDEVPLDRERFQTLRRKLRCHVEA